MQFLGRKFVFIKLVYEPSQKNDAKALENFGKVRVLPGSNYGMLIFDLNEDTVPSGPSLAKHVGSALRRCAEEFGADTTDISVAQDVYGEPEEY